MLSNNKENQRVRRNIMSALMELMEKKPFSLITITELILRAKVARASYYRNFSSKEDILKQKIREMIEYFTSTADYDLQDYQSYANILHALECMQHFQPELHLLLEHGFYRLCLDALNQYLETVAGDMPQSSVTRYELYFFTGALFNVAVNWLSNPSPEPVDQVARSFYLTLTGKAPD